MEVARAHTRKVGQAIGRLIDLCYLPPLRRIFPPTVFRYAACGGITLAVDAICYALIFHLVVAGRFFDLGFVTVSPPIASLILVFPITFLTGFWLNRHVVFASPGAVARRPAPQFFRYALSVGGAILLNYACMKLLVEACGLWPTPSKITTSLISALYSYAAARYFTFRGSMEIAE